MPRFAEGPGRVGSLKVGSGSGGFGDGSGNGFESWWLQGWFQGRFPGVLLYLHFHSESNELSANIPHNVQNELYKKVPALYAQNLSSLCQTSMVLLKQPPHELESVLQVL